MKRIGTCLLAFSTLLPGLAAANDRLPDCFTFRYEAEQSSPDNLRQIARSCPIQPVANLYFNRAYHLDLIDRQAARQSIQRVGSEDLGRVLEAYRMYIALIEVFATRSAADVPDIISAMNRGYEEAGEIAELRFRGYEQRANWLEQMRSVSDAKPD